MLVLTRKLDQSILIGPDIEIKIVGIKGSGDQALVRIGISAPKQVSVLRKEVFEEVASENRQAAVTPDSAGLEGLLQELKPATQREGP